MRRNRHVTACFALTSFCAAVDRPPRLLTASSISGTARYASSSASKRSRVCREHAWQAASVCSWEGSCGLRRLRRQAGMAGCTTRVDHTALEGSTVQDAVAATAAIGFRYSWRPLWKAAHACTYPLPGLANLQAWKTGRQKEQHVGDGAAESLGAALVTSLAGLRGRTGRTPGECTAGPASGSAHQDDCVEDGYQQPAAWGMCREQQSSGGLTLWWGADSAHSLNHRQCRPARTMSRQCQ